MAANTDVKAIKFITCATANPPKRDVLAYLGIPLMTGELIQVSKTEPVRRADVDVSESLYVFFHKLRQDNKFIDVVTGYVVAITTAFKSLNRHLATHSILF